ncbi:synaptonemal complex protein 2-like [Colossoma macropomum]|uniref:synaptonemal complex protein 2-like n=1 Tax=Colossoma macropomum TaxID=42526 RepID=UPI00186463BD|nr:synaptonemal complex protein 2-like [Colossoma macropomum]
MATDPGQQMESLVDEALKHSNFKGLEHFLLEETSEGRTSKCSNKFISKLDKLINRELDHRNVKNASVVFTILHKWGDTLVFPVGEGISAMVSQGLVRKMVQWFERVRKLWIEAGLVRSEVMLNLAEDFFDALMAVHESCKEGTYQITESLLHHIGKLASDAHVNILIQKEAVRKLNVVLGKIPVELKKEKKILSSQEASTVMDDLASRILKGGDYDLQVALMEALCRMSSRAQRRELADHWFSMEFVATAFRNIQDSEFETDCRKFLNLVNGMQGDGRSVYSYPCLEVFLDKCALLMPVDENLKEFWIDFNLGSQSISFYFCLSEDQAQVLGQWDTLCIAENEIHSYTVEEEKDVKVLQLVLTEPVCVSNIEGSKLAIHFSSSLDILQATKKVYGEAKNKKFVGKTTTSVVKTTVQIILDEGCSQVLFPESQASSEPMEKTVPTSVRNSTPFQPLPYHEKDAQRKQQTLTPLRSKVSESCMYVSGSAGCKLGRSPFSCVMPATTPVGKTKVRPALEMVASSGRKKDAELRDLLLARSLHRVPSFSEEKENIKKQVFSPLQSADVPQDRKDRQEAERYRRHIPVDKVLEMVHADQELEEQPLDSSIVPDSQPAVRKETSILPGLNHFAKNKRISVSRSLLPCQKELPQSKSVLIAPAPLSTELPLQPSSAQHSSGVLTHKELHAQLTQRLEQVLREQEQQGEPSATVQKRKSSVGHAMLEPGGPEKGTGPVTESQRPTPAKPAPSRQATSNVDDRNKTAKAADSMVKQISSRYKSTDFIKAAPEMASQFNIAPTNRYLFNRSWYAASAAKLADKSEFLKSCSQSKKSPNQHEDVFEFSADVPELSGKKYRKSSEMPRIESSNSPTLSNSAKKCPPAKPTGRNVKKHLFSDTDTENMTDVSWLKSANRRPKPKVADYTRQPVKPSLPPADTTFETPNIPVPSTKAAKVLPKPKRKRQKKVVEQKNKTNQDVASRKPTGRPQRTAAQTRSYREPSDSGSESETDEPPPAKKLIIKQTEKPLRRDVQAGGQAENKDKTSSKAALEQTVRENNQAKSKASQKVMQEKTERGLPSPEQYKKKKKPPTSMESTKRQKESWASKIASFCTSPPSTNKMRSGEESAVLPRSPLTPPDPLLSKLVVRQPENTQKKASVQATRQAEKKEKVLSDVMDQPDKQKKQQRETIMHSDADHKLMQKKVGKLSSHEQSKSKKTPAPQESAKEDRESWVTKLASLCPSPFSVEKMRSAERSAALTRSPITPLRLPSFSPVAAVSPPLEPPDHLQGIQASSFYRTSVGQNSVNLPLPPPVTPNAKKQNAPGDAELSPMPSMAQPLIASTGRETLARSSLLNSPDLEEDLRGFLNDASHRGLHASFDKESVISLVTLSQSSHRSVNNIAMICTNLEKTPECTLGIKTEKAEFLSGPASHRKRHSSCKSASLSEIEDSEEEEEGEAKVVPSELAIKMRPRKLFKPNDKPWHKKKVDQSSSEEEEKNESEIRRRPTGVTKKSSHTPQSRSPSATVEDVEMCSTVLSNVVSSCWEAGVEADIDLPRSEISTSQEMGFVCRQFSTELKRKFENRSRRMDLFTKQSLKAFKQHVSSISMQVHKYRSQSLEKVKGVLMDEIKNLEQDDTALRTMEEELASYWKKQVLAFHAYQERGTRRLHNLKSAIETNVLHSLEFEEQIFSSQMCLMKKDIKSVQDRLFKQMQEEELLSVRRGLQTLFLPDVAMF